ncbi:MAG: YggS family pyridoxal phosphate-dependent enzyme [Candidatus Omnitrophota bacterium]
MDVLERLENLKRKISATAAKAGKTSDSIQLVCVIKQAKISDIIKVIRSGYVNLAENKVQSLQEKYSLLKDNLSPDEFSQIIWHLIGHLQTNKVKPALDLVSMIQSVDSLHLAERISRQAQKINKKIDILVQVNISCEESKFGIEISDVTDFILKIINLPGINIKGLMGIGPFVEDAEQTRGGFRKLAEVFKQTNKILEARGNFSLTVLSLGMSNDYLVAIEEGSNMLRIGSEIFKD